MRANRIIGSFLSVFLVLGAWAYTQEKPLAEIYKTGKVRFIQGKVISDESLPEGQFFSNILDVAVDGNGYIYLCDCDAHNIKKFNPQGKFVKVIGKEGQGPGDFTKPLKIEVLHDKLVVWESRNLRVSILSLDGHFIKSVPYDFQGLGWPYDVKTLSKNRIVFETRITYRRGPSRPEECILRLFSHDIEHILDIYKREFWGQKNITKPRRMSIPVPFSARVHWDISPQGHIIIGFSESYNVEIYDPEKGKIASFTHEFEPIVVTKKDKEIYFAGMTVSISDGQSTSRKTGAPDYIVDNTEFPKYKPAFDDIKCDYEGNIWVHTFHRDPKIAGRSFDAFDEKGKFLNKVLIEEKGRYPRNARMKNRSFWIIEVDSEGFYKVAEYQISR